MTSKRPRLFYGWLIVCVSAVGLFLGPPLIVFSFSVFFKSLVLDFHASRAAVSFAFSLFNIVGALLIPCTGMVIDRFGAKRVILVFTLLYGLILCAALWVGSSLWQLYLFFTSPGSCDGQRPRARSLRSCDFALVQSPSRTCTGALNDGNWNWLRRRSNSRTTPHRHLRVARAFAIFGGAVLLVPLPVWLRCCRTTPDNEACNRMETRKLSFRNCCHRTRTV